MNIFNIFGGYSKDDIKKIIDAKSLEYMRYIDSLKKSCDARMQKITSDMDLMKKMHNNQIKLIEDEFEDKKKKLLDCVMQQHIEIEKEKDDLMLQKTNIANLLSYELNESMISIYKECFEYGLSNLKEFYETKKNPSKKASEFILEFKEYIKELEIDNRKLRLALSEYVDGIEGYNEIVKQRRLESLKEYNSLSKVERQEMKLKKVIEKHKDQLEIGYSFERYYGYTMEEKGYSVKYHGILNGVKDGGVDLIAKTKSEIIYIQCKYWSKSKEIKENTISQLYGSSLNMALQNGLTIDEFNSNVKDGKIKMVLATHTVLSNEAKEFAKRLGIKYEENIEMVDYPMVKLVDGDDKIYYIPTDDQYDNIVYNSTNKKYGRCKSCYEAENLGYRGAKKWLGSKI